MSAALHTWALRLLPLYKVSLICAAAGSLVSMGLLFELDALQALSIQVAFVFTLWALTLFAFINLFRKPAPLILPALNWRERTLARIQLGLYRGAALAFCLLVVVVFSLSVKLLMHG